MYKEIIDDDDILKLIEHLVDSFSIDVSNYNMEESDLLDTLVYAKSNTLKTGEKYINKSLGIGSQISQISGIYYVHKMDNYCKIVKGMKYYGRYMDDFYLIVQSKEYAKWCLFAIYEFVHSLGLELNGKTQIIPFKNGIKFCGFHTYVTTEGKVIRKLKNENKRAAKKKFIKMVRLVKRGELSKEKFYESYNAWKNHISHGNCVKLGYEMDRCVEELFGK